MATTISNHVISMTAQDDDYAGWVCIDHIIWVGATNAAHTLEVNDAGGKSVLEPVRAGSATEDREIKMHGKWALGLHLEQVTSLTRVDFYLRTD